MIDDRMFSARERTKAEGLTNEAEERILSEQWEATVEEHGEPWLERLSKKGKPVGFSKLFAPFWAAWFAVRHDALFEADEGRFYSYDPECGLWAVESPEENLMRLAAFLLTEARRLDQPEIEERRTVAFMSDVQRLLRGIVAKRGVFARDLDAIEQRVPLANGTFLLRDSKPEGFQKHFSKFHYSRNGIPFAFDPDAKCERFLNEFLLPAMPEETACDDALLLQKLAGQFVLGENLAQKILLIDGEGGSGKSALISLFALLIGEANVAELRTEHLAGRFETFGFVGKTLVIGSDVPPKFLLTPGAVFLKKLTGGDLLSAEAKTGNERFNFRGNLNVVISANSELKIRLEDDAPAWERRLVRFTWRKTPRPKNIRDFERVLMREESSGIVAWAVHGLELVLADLKEHGELIMTEAQRQRTKDIVLQSDWLREFLCDHVGKEDGSELLKTELRGRIWEHCQQRRWHLPSKRELGSRLKVLVPELFEARESNSCGVSQNASGFRGVTWRED